MEHPGPDADISSMVPNDDLAQHYSPNVLQKLTEVWGSVGYKYSPSVVNKLTSSQTKHKNGRRKGLRGGSSEAINILHPHKRYKYRRNRKTKANPPFSADGLEPCKIGISDQGKIGIAGEYGFGVQQQSAKLVPASMLLDVINLGSSPKMDTNPTYITSASAQLIFDSAGANIPQV